VYLNLSKDSALPVVCHDTEVCVMEEHGSTILCDNDWIERALRRFLCTCGRTAR
jgi:hypothetical protein